MCGLRRLHLHRLYAGLLQLRVCDDVHSVAHLAQQLTRVGFCQQHQDAVSCLLLVWNRTVWSGSWDRSICIWT